MAMKKAQTSMFEVGTPNDILALVPAHPVMAGPFTIFLHNIFRLSDFYKYKIRTRSEKQNLRFSSSNSKLHSFAFLLRLVSISQKHQDKYKLHLQLLLKFDSR